MKRYAIHVSAYVYVDVENNVAEAATLAKRFIEIIGERSGAFKTQKDRDFTHYRVELGELRFGRPIRLPSPLTA